MPTPSASSESPAESSSRCARGIPGSWVVAGMFAFGLLATGVLFAYWHYHTAPYQELQAALAQEFPGSRPRVEGGQRKQHKGTPRTLRIVLKVDFPPAREAERSERMAEGVLKLAEEHHDMSLYDVAEIHLYWPEKEKEIHEHLIERQLQGSWVP
jgi:hypothetical protein